MGLYYCKNCGEENSNKIEHFACICGNRWCSEQCATEDQFHDSEFVYERYCKDCFNTSEFLHNKLLDFALKKLDTTKEELLKEYLRI